MSSGSFGLGNLVAVATNSDTSNNDTAAMPCAKCGQAMRLSYCESLESDGRLKIFECHQCRTTTTVVGSSAD